MSTFHQRIYCCFWLILISIACYISATVKEKENVSDNQQCEQFAADTANLVHMFANVSNLPSEWDLSICDACEWVGTFITCDTDTNTDTNTDGNKFIKTLRLDYFPNTNRQLLSGALNTTVAWPPNMIDIQLENHALVGELSWAKLPQSLRYLRLISNHFSGPINFMELPSSLIQLKLKGNAFAGDLDFGAVAAGGVLFEHLQYLDVSDNELNGALRMDAILGGAYPSLYSLYLNGNLLEGTLSVVSLPPHLRSLDASSNFLASLRLPTAADGAHNTSTLVNLDVSNNDFSGTLDLSATAFPELDYFNIAYNDYTALTMDGFAALAPSLDELRLEHNQFEGAVAWPEFPLYIEFIHLSHNAFTGDVRIGNGFPYLDELWIDHNQFESFDLYSINNSWVTFIDASHNNIATLWPDYDAESESGAESASAWYGFDSSRLPDTLQDLDLSHNELSGAVLINFNASRAQALNSVDLRYNNFSSVVFVPGDYAFNVYLDKAVICDPAHYCPNANASFPLPRTHSFCNSSRSCNRTCRCPSESAPTNDEACTDYTPNTRALVRIFAAVQNLPAAWDLHTCDACQWLGTFITCDKQLNATVKTLRMDYFPDTERPLLSGALDTAVKWPPQMMDIELENHALSGVVDWDKLPESLRYLRLIGNQFSGALDFSALPLPLVQLKLKDNAFSGALDFDRKSATANAGAAGDLVHLQYLDVSGNEFDRLDMSAIIDGRYPSLYSLYINGNLLEGHLDLTALPTHLRSLDASSNFFTSLVFPHSSSLVNLDISNNDFSGTLQLTPAVLGTHPNLDFFSAGYNAYTVLDTFDFFKAAPGMDELKLQHNDIYGTVPMNDLPAEMEYLYLDHNRFFGSIAIDAAFVPFDYLDEFWVDYNNIEFIDLSTFSDTWITFLNAAHNEITHVYEVLRGEALPEIGFSSSNAPPTLQYLDLSHNEMRGKVVINFSDYAHDWYSIDLRFNAFSSVRFIDGFNNFDVYLDKAVVCDPDYYCHNVDATGNVTDHPVARTHSFCNDSYSCQRTCVCAWDLFYTHAPSAEPSSAPTAADETASPTRATAAPTTVIRTSKPTESYTSRKPSATTTATPTTSTRAGTSSPTATTVIIDDGKNNTSSNFDLSHGKTKTSSSSSKKSGRVSTYILAGIIVVACLICVAVMYLCYRCPMWSRKRGQFAQIVKKKKARSRNKQRAIRDESTEESDGTGTATGTGTDGNQTQSDSDAGEESKSKSNAGIEMAVEDIAADDVELSDEEDAIVEI